MASVALSLPVTVDCHIVGSNNESSGLLHSNSYQDGCFHCFKKIRKSHHTSSDKVMNYL